MEKVTVYLKYDKGLDMATVLRNAADQIVNGRIVCTGIERREDEEDGVYYVKDCGKYELVIVAPCVDSFPIYDVDGHGIVALDVRRKG